MWGKVRTFAHCEFGSLPFAAKKMQFTGKIQARMDAKGRVFFPADFRKEMGAGELRFVLKRDVYQPCLVIYPYATWAAEVAELRNRLNRWVPSEAMVLRQFLSDAEVFTLDANGRFIVPRRFQETCGLTKSVAFIGLDDRIELWSAPRADEPFLGAEEFSDALQRLMRNG